MRYKLDTDKQVNRLVPHLWGSRSFVLHLQSLLYPLQTLNDRFSSFAREKRIDAAMTSQVMYFEWYLNRRFSQYFTDAASKIHISESEMHGIELFHENDPYGRPFSLWYENEKVETDVEDEMPREIYYQAEEKDVSKASFYVCVPAVGIPQREFVNMLSEAVNTYKVAGRTYLIKIDNEELKPMI